MSSPTTAQPNITRLEKKRQRDEQATEGFFTKIFGSMKRYNERPFPWCLLPDSAWFAMGCVSLLLISVPCISLILLSTVTGEMVRYLMRTPVGSKLYAQARDGIHGAAHALAKVIMIDPRNYSFLPWTIFEALVLPILAYIAYKRHMANGFEFSSMIIYHFLRLGPRYRLFAHHQVLIHKEGHAHKGLFKGPLAALNRINSMWVGLFYGTMTGSYSAGHNKIHHRWHNDADDVHSNIDLDRSIFSNYILWLPRFFFYWTGISCLALFLKRAEYRLAAEIFFGQAWWFLGMCVIARHAGLLFVLAYFVYPMGESIAFLGSMGYLWHSFVQPEDPANQYINSITILDGQDNIWNEDYHVVHHHAPFVHWSEADKFYKETEEKYRECTATIFRDCEEGLLIYWIFSAKWDTLAEHFVDLNGKLNHEEKKELLLRRLRYHRMGGFHDDESAGSWGTSEIRDWDTTSKEEQDAKKTGDSAILNKHLPTFQEEVKRQEDIAAQEEIPVTEYVVTFVDTVMYGMSEPATSHFAPRYQDQSIDSALTKHEQTLANTARFNESSTLLDAACFDGRAGRTIARFLKSAKIVGVNANPDALARCRRYDRWAKLSGQTSYFDSYKSIGDNTFDGAFAVEASARATLPSSVNYYAEVFRTLKAGASFVGYEWVLTEKFDSNNAEHAKLRSQIEGLCLATPLQTAAKLLAAIKAAGFDVTESYDAAEQYESSPAKTIPWHAALEGDFSSYANFKNTPAGRLFIKAFVAVMESTNCAPKGSSDNVAKLEERDNALIKAGKLGIISPCYFFHAVAKK